MNLGQRGPNARARGRLLLIAEGLLWTVGVLAVATYAYVRSEAYLYQTYESWRLDQLRQGRPGSLGLLAKSGLEDLWAQVLGRPANPGSGNLPGRGNRNGPKAGSLVGRIEIPRIGLSSIVLEGDDPSVLRVAAGHVPGTAVPGQPGNVAIAGHRDTFFRELRNLHRNDEITFTTPEGTYRYWVKSAEIVSPNDTAVLGRTDQPSLTLVTCYPFSYLGSAPERFVVRAAANAPDVPRLNPELTRLSSESAAPLLPVGGPRTALYRKHQPRHRPISPDESVAPATVSGQDLSANDSPAQEPANRGLLARLRKGWSRFFARRRANQKRPADSPAAERVDAAATLPP